MLGEGIVPSRFEALRASSLTPLVGREEQLNTLLRRWERVRTGTDQVVLISGEPGLGKSRIVVAFQDRLQGQPHIQRRYFCSPHHSDTALYPLIDQLERAVGFGRDDPPSGKLEKLRAVLAPSATSDHDISLFAELLSVPRGDGIRSLEVGFARSREKSVLAFMRQIERLAASEPVLVIFEDAHWSDPTSIELLNLAIERIRELPVLLILTFRPEF